MTDTPTDYPVEVGTDEYFDPNAVSDSWPGILGLNMRTHHWWQGDAAWDTYEELGPGEGSIHTTVPDSSASNGDSAAPGGTPGSLAEILVPNVNGIPLTQCVEDGTEGDLVGLESNSVQILLQGVQDIGDFFFPVNPEELTVDFGQDNDYDTDVIGVGEITIPGTPRLESVSWSSFLPVRFDDSYVSIPAGLLYNPDYAMWKLIESKRRRLVMFLTIGGTPWNDFVIIKGLKWSVKAGEPGDIYYNIELKRYKDVSIQTVTVPNAGITDPRDAPVLQGPNQNQGGGANPTPDNPNGSDGSRGANEVPVNTAPNIYGPAPTIADSLRRIGAGASQDLVQTDYTVGLSGLYGQSLQQVFEDLVRQGFGLYNTLDTLIADNADNPTTVFGYDYYSPSGRKQKVGEYAPNEPLPLGTLIKYWKLIKIQAPPVAQPQSTAAILSGPIVSPGSSPGADLLKRLGITLPGGP
jgi:hypothetical protein